MNEQIVYNIVAKENEWIFSQNIKTPDNRNKSSQLHFLPQKPQIIKLIWMPSGSKY